MTTAVKIPVSVPEREAPSAATGDLTDRQVRVFAMIAAAVLLAALAVLVLYSGPGVVPASTSFQDLLQAASATSI